MRDIHYKTAASPHLVCVAYPPQDTWVGCVRGNLEVGLSV